MQPDQNNNQANIPSSQPGAQGGAGQVPPAQYQQPVQPAPQPQPVPQQQTYTPVNQQQVMPQQPMPQPQVGGVMPGQNQSPEQIAQGKSNPNSTQNTLQVAEIRDGIAIMADGSYRAVLYAKSVNFDLMSGAEREAVEAGFQGFLNSLYYDVQIYMHSQKIDMRPYLERLQQQRDQQDNMLLSMLMEDYIYFIEDLVARANIMDKSFYVIVPFKPPTSANKVVSKGKGFFGNIFGSSNQVITINEKELEEAKTELGNRVQATMNGLTNMGVQSVPLDTQELIELFYDAYNPDTATRQSLAPIRDLEAPVVTKGQGEAKQPNLDGLGY